MKVVSLYNSQAKINFSLGSHEVHSSLTLTLVWSPAARCWRIGRPSSSSRRRTPKRRTWSSSARCIWSSLPRNVGSSSYTTKGLPMTSGSSGGAGGPEVIDLSSSYSNSDSGGFGLGSTNWEKIMAEKDYKPDVDALFKFELIKKINVLVFISFKSTSLNPCYAM